MHVTVQQKMTLAHSARLLVLLCAAFGVALASDYRTCTSSCSANAVVASSRVEPYRACPVANSSAVYISLKRQLVGSSTVCGAALQAVAERISNEVCEVGVVSVPLCAESARTYLSAYCGNSAARTLLSQPPLSQLAATSATPAQSCAVMNYSPNATWLVWAGLLLAVCSGMLLLVGRHLERQGRWRSGATGRRVFTDPTWLAGWSIAIFSVFGGLLALGMTPLHVLGALVVPAVAVSSWSHWRQSATWAALLLLAVLASICIPIVSPSFTPRLTPGAVSWLFSVPLMWLGVLCVGLAAAAAHTVSARTTPGPPDSGTLAVVPCNAASSSCAHGLLTAPPVGCLSLALLASLLASTATSACKALVEIILGTMLNGFMGPSVASDPLFWILLLLAMGAGLAASVAFSRLFNVYSAELSTLASAAGLNITQCLFSLALWRVAAGSEVAVLVLLVTLQSGILCAACIAQAHDRPRAPSGIGGEPVGQGLPHKVSLPDSAALPSLATLGFEGGLEGGLDTSMASTGTDVPTPARKLLGWFNSAAGAAGRRVGGISYSRVKGADPAGSRGGSGRSTPEGGGDEGVMLDMGSDEEHESEVSPLRGVRAAPSTGATDDARGALAELDVFDSDEDIDWSKA